jgi:acetyl esterase/lipase
MQSSETALSGDNQPHKRKDFMRNLFLVIIMTAALIFLPEKARANIFESIWGQATATFSTIFNLKPSWSIYRDIAYGSHADEKADLYLLPGGNHPAVVFIHGGGWAGGDKSAYANY